VTNIHNLGYTYDKLIVPPKSRETVPHLRVSGINRTTIAGSFAVSVWVTRPDPEDNQFVGIEPVLSRWHITGCANCNNHLEFMAHMPLMGWPPEDAENASFEVMVHTREGVLGTPGGVVPRVRLGRLKPVPITPEN